MVKANILNEFLNFECTDDYLEREYKSNEAHDKLMRTIASWETGYKYPEHYAGDYLDDGELVICVCNDTDSIKEFYFSKCKSKEINFKRVEFPLNKLESIMEYINSYIAEYADTDLVKNLNRISEDIIKNKIIIRMKKLNEKNIQKFKTMILDDKAIIFEEENIDFKPMQQTVNAGHPLSNSTLGYRVRRGGVDGFIVSGHAYSPGANITDSIGNNIGRVQQNAWQRSGSVDAGWSSGTNLNLTNTIQRLGGTLSPQIGWPEINSTVLSSGKTSGLIGGSLISRNDSVQVGDVWHSNIMIGNWGVQDGDSGGPVFWNISGTTYLTAGNIIGGNAMGWIVIGRAGFIRDNLQVNRY